MNVFLPIDGWCLQENCGSVGGGVPVNSVNPVNPGESHMRPARVWVYIEGWVTGRVRFPNVRKLVTRERESEGELISPWVGLF